VVEALKARFALLPLLLAFPSAASAHRLDEYLQATLVAIEPAGVRLQINLTPGVAVANLLLAGIDRDHDDAISQGEAAAYASRLKGDLALRLDGQILDLTLTASDWPAPAELRGGVGFIQMEFSASYARLGAGAHRLAFENRHLPAVSVYLINAELPRSRTIRITGQKRNASQATGEIDFTFVP
jgi:hypothetical protein